MTRCAILKMNTCSRIGDNWVIPLLTNCIKMIKFNQNNTNSIGVQKMSKISFQFDRRKAIESILYLASRISDSDIYGICKLLYLVDKTSLEKYGRFVFGETYWAMKAGSTPSKSYDLLKESAQSNIDGITRDGDHIIATRDANLDYLSESDIECLDQIISLWGRAPNWARGNAAHDNAWEQAWAKKGLKSP
jgi:uncharacterized phage-associated protein